jgi:Kef-type K+ transport system membrane component KefB
MEQNLFLQDLFFYFLTTAMFVPFFKFCGLSSVMGYLCSGVVLGPYVFGFLHHGDHIHNISEFGIIILMFVIGLELSSARMSHLKKQILGKGLLQFVLTTLVLFPVIGQFDLDNKISFLIAAALSLSSTAFSLSWLKEHELLTKSYGQASIGILIFQDLIFIPLLSVIPFVANNPNSSEADYMMFGLKLVGVLCSLAIVKKTMIPLLSRIFVSQGKEIFIGSCLMFILGTSLLMGYLGLSKALGALVAGIFLSGSEIKSTIKNFSLPIKDMLMGIFFMGFGLNFNLTFFAENAFAIFAFTVPLLFIKGVVIFALGFFGKMGPKNSLFLGLALCQGGEFGLLVIDSLARNTLIEASTSNLLLSCITISIFCSPILCKVALMMESRQGVSSESKAVENELNEVEGNNVVPLKKAS